MSPLYFFFLTTTRPLVIQATRSIIPIIKTARVISRPKVIGKGRTIQSQGQVVNPQILATAIRVVKRRAIRCRYFIRYYYLQCWPRLKIVPLTVAAGAKVRSKIIEDFSTLGALEEPLIRLKVL